MNFLAFRFFLFLSVFLVAYYIYPQKEYQKYIVLLGNGFIAFLFGAATFITVVLVGILSFAVSNLIYKANESKKKSYLAGAIVAFVGILLGFRCLPYTSIENIVVPVGVSFYTLQAVSLLIEVYRGTLIPLPFSEHLLYLTFFPYFTSGPIERPNAMVQQIRTPHKFDIGRLREGLIIFLHGAVMKMVVAERLATAVNTVYGTYNTVTGLELAIGSIFYTLQIYADFAGYSFLAIGLGKMLGYCLINNFKQPYFADSVIDFWKRWHISLTSWFRDYLYIPLGGNRRGKTRQYMNILIVFAVSGIWHGFGVNYLIWGILHGLLQIIVYLFRRITQNSRGMDRLRNTNIYTVIAMAVTFLCVNFMWIFFRVEDLSQALCIVKSIVFNFRLPENGIRCILEWGLDKHDYVVLMLTLGYIFVADVLREADIIHLNGKTGKLAGVQWVLLWILVFAVLIFGCYGLAFDSSNFIYFKY